MYVRPPMNATVEGIRAWLGKNAPLIAAALPAGATPQALDQAEGRLGHPLPPSLRQLWSLHAGGPLFDGFGVYSHFLPPDQAEDASDVHSIEWDDEALAQSKLTAEEAASLWVVFSGLDHDQLVVSTQSQRVGIVEKDWPPVNLIAPSLEDFLKVYLEALNAGRYRLDGKTLKGPSLDALFDLDRH